MKKLLLYTAMLMTVAAFAHADTVGTPQGKGNPLATADYGGVNVATISFSSANFLLFGSGGGSVSWFHVSSNTSSTDFLSFRSTGNVSPSPNNGLGADFVTTDEIARVYISTNALSPSSGFLGTGTTEDLAVGYTYTFPSPMRSNRGLAVKANVHTIRMITIGYTKFD